MKKAILFVAVSAFLGFMALGSVASADSTVPLSNFSSDASGTMSVGQTIMQMGAFDRINANAVNLGSRSGTSRSISGVMQNYQFGSSQTDQSWKAARTIEEAQVRGLVPGDCNGDNSDGVYRSQMNQSRKGFAKEILVSIAQCGEYHPTLK